MLAVGKTLTGKLKGILVAVIVLAAGPRDVVSPTTMDNLNTVLNVWPPEV